MAKTEAACGRSELYVGYAALLREYMPTVGEARVVLQDPHHELWRRVVGLVSAARGEEVAELLGAVYEAFGSEFGVLPAGAVRRPGAKGVRRLMRKVGSVVAREVERNACADWIACRIEARVGEFEVVKGRVAQVLGEGVAVVWKVDDVGARGRGEDISQFGYAYRVGGAAVMEIQVVEPVAGWVFEMNSRAKHQGEAGCVTFGESKELFEALKRIILHGDSTDALPMRGNVLAYYEKVRESRVESLDYAELERMQALVDEVVSRYSA